MLPKVKKIFRFLFRPDFSKTWASTIRHYQEVCGIISCSDLALLGNVVQTDKTDRLILLNDKKMKFFHMI